LGLRLSQDPHETSLLSHAVNRKRAQKYRSKAALVHGCLLRVSIYPKVTFRRRGKAGGHTAPDALRARIQLTGENLKLRHIQKLLSGPRVRPFAEKTIAPPARPVKRRRARGAACFLRGRLAFWDETGYA
jgi:hypothetical protein